MTKPDLVLLTDQFPFGFESEPYLESEIPVLSERFNQVYLLPSVRRTAIRPVPANVEVVEMPWLSPASSRDRIRALASTATPRILIESLRTWKDLLAYGPVAKFYADILSRNIIKSRQLHAFTASRDLSDAVFCDYWFHNSTLALSLLRQRGEISCAASRAHRFDIFAEAWDGRPVPFQQAKAVGLDAVYPTSDAGAAYLAAHVPGLRSKLEVHRLGAPDPGSPSPPPSPSAPPLVLTCARLAPVKRIDRVPRILAELGETVRWVHIGDGTERAKVEAAARLHLPAGSWELLGQLPNRDALDFYRDNGVNLLLSVASSEGLPVSMMEAQSFGVPIVSCDVGGIAEIVNDRTGVLVDRDASDAEIAAALRSCLQNPELSRDGIRAQYRRKYDARANYEAFATALLALHGRRGSSNRGH